VAICRPFDTEHSAGSCLVELLEGILFGEDRASSWKNDAAQWIHENRSRTGAPRSHPRADKTLLDHHRRDDGEAGLNILRQHVTEHPAGGSLAAG